MNLRQKLGQTLALFLMLFSFLCWAAPAKAQTIADAENAFDMGLVDVAAEIAFQVYQGDQRNLTALRLYCEYASKSGNTRAALPYSEKLFYESLSWNDAARHARRLAFAGELSDARVWANIAGSGSNPNLVEIDRALARKYIVDFEFRPKTLTSRRQQGYDWNLQPYFHIPIPIDVHPWQASKFSVSGAVRSIMIGSGDKRFLKIEPRLNSRNEPELFYVNCEVGMSPWDCRTSCAAAPWGYPASLQASLAETDSINFGHPEVERLAKHLRRSTPFDTVNEVCDHISKNIFYVPRGYNGNGTASEILAKGYGHCASRTGLVVALLRCNGIPARALRGHSGLRGDGRSLGVSRHHHSILEFYLDGVGWVPWDFNQTPGVVIPDFLALWAYEKSRSDSGPAEATLPLHWIQRVGLPDFSGAYHYADFTLQRRYW